MHPQNFINQNKTIGIMYQFTTKKEAAEKIMKAAEGWSVIVESQNVVNDVKNALEFWDANKEFFVAVWAQGAEGGEKSYIGRLMQKVNKTCVLIHCQHSVTYGIVVNFRIVQK